MVHRSGLPELTGGASPLAGASSEVSGTSRSKCRRLLQRKILQKCGIAVLVLAGAGLAISAVLAALPGPEGTSFWCRTTDNLITFGRLVIFQYDGLMLYENKPVLHELFEGGLISFQLIFGALLVVMILGVGTGLLLALKPRHMLVKVWAGIVHGLSSAPVLVFGLILIVIITGFFRVPPYRQMLGLGGCGTDALIYLLPVLTLAFGDSLLYDVVRTVNRETRRLLEEDFIKAARARNVPLRRHLYKGLAAPIVATFASKVTYLIGGSVVVEYIFGWEGLAYQVLTALLKTEGHDYPFLLGATALFVLVAIVINLISEIVTLISDPRLCKETAGGLTLQDT